jgi:hypothetical protein
MKEEYSADIYYPGLFVLKFIINLLGFILYTALFHSASVKAQSTKISPAITRFGLAEGVPALSECGF